MKQNAIKDILSEFKEGKVKKIYCVGEMAEHIWLTWGDDIEQISVNGFKGIANFNDRGDKRNFEECANIPEIPQITGFPLVANQDRIRRLSLACGFGSEAEIIKKCLSYFDFLFHNLGHFPGHFFYIFFNINT